MTNTNQLPPGRATLIAAVEELLSGFDQPCHAEPQQQGPLDPRWLRSKSGHGSILPDGRRRINGRDAGPTKEWLATQGM